MNALCALLAVVLTAASAEERRVTYVGEAHKDPVVKAELASRMVQLKADGFTHFAVELLGDDRQPFLDDFAAGRVTLQRLAEVIAEEWVHEPEANAGMLDAARRAGLKLVALDLPGAERRALLAYLAADPAMFEADPAPHGRRWALPTILAAQVVRARDERMADNIARLLADPGAKVLAVVGRFHAHKGFQPARLRALGHDSYSVDAAEAPGSPFDPRAFDGRFR